jgi:2-iminobutanoate/2-iminopropanoate deaminase
VKYPVATFPGSPPALGPYSLGVIAEGKFLFVSGMTPFDPVTGKIDCGSISRQTGLVLENIMNVLVRGIEACSCNHWSATFGF